MNKIIIVFLIGFLVFSFKNEVNAQCNEQLVNNCALSVGDNATYLKDFKVKLKKAKRNSPPPVARFSVVLNKGTHYRFTLCNANDYEGEGVIQLYDAQRLLGSTINMKTGQEYKSFDFLCKKSAIYQVFISFKGGKEGCCVGILSMVK